MTSLAAAVDTASVWVWTGGWRTVAWRRAIARLLGRSARGVLRVVLWVLMLPPFLLAATARLTARGWVGVVWAAGWALSWTVAAFAAGWTAAGGDDDDGPPPWV